MTRRIELSPRLRLAADLVPEGARLADVGTDHAYLPACLLMEGKIPSAIAADLREGPLSRARETAAEYGCGDRMAFRLCDGLSGIRPEKTDAVVIAGMGGETIAQILEAAPWVRNFQKKFVLMYCLGLTTQLCSKNRLLNHLRACGERLEDDYCGNADERLIVAAQIVAETIAADFNR